jgi:hypothetical protein
MTISSKWFSALLIILVTLLVLVGCKPTGDLVIDPKTGALVSPISTPLSVIAILPTSVSPLPTPPPWAITPPAPTPTPGAVVGPQSVYDPLNRFSVKLLPGWYAYVPDANAVGGITTITNYDLNRIDNRPPGGLSIQISIGQLGAEQSFEQWLSDRRALETSAENGSFGVTLTKPQPYTLGRYTGFTYTAHDPLPSGESVTVIYLLTSDGRIVGIGLRPVGVPALSDGLSILSTIEILPKPSR